MQIAIGLYPGLTALDVVGPYQILTLVPGVEVVLCAEHSVQPVVNTGAAHA